jgi:hypothetical protein
MALDDTSPTSTKVSKNDLSNFRMPIWAWALVLGGGAVFVYEYRKAAAKNSASAAAANTSAVAGAGGTIIGYDASGNPIYNTPPTSTSGTNGSGASTIVPVPVLNGAETQDYQSLLANIQQGNGDVAAETSGISNLQNGLTSQGQQLATLTGDVTGLQSALASASTNPSTPAPAQQAQATPSAPPAPTYDKYTIQAGDTMAALGNKYFGGGDTEAAADQLYYFDGNASVIRNEAEAHGYTSDYVAHIWPGETISVP